MTEEEVEIDPCALPRISEKETFRNTFSRDTRSSMGQTLETQGAPLVIDDRYEDILKEARWGGCGNYQIMVVTMVLCGMIGQAFLDYNVAYLIMFPEFICDDTGEVCYAEDICQGESSPQVDYHINYNDQFSLHNWVQQYDLICSTNLQIAMFGQLSFASAAIFNIPVTMLSDKFGRRFLFRCGVIGQSLVFICLMLNHIRPISYGAMFLEGMWSPFINMVGYVYMCEFLPKKWQDYVATIYCFTYASVILILTFYFQIISNRYQWIMAVGTLQLICASVLSFIIVESPIWLLNKGKMKEAMEAIRKVCQMNGILDRLEDKILELPIQFKNNGMDMTSETSSGLDKVQVDAGDGNNIVSKLNPSQQSDDNDDEEAPAPIACCCFPSCCQCCFFLKDRKIAQNLAAMCFMWAMASQLYYFMSYYLIYLPGNTYNNCYASGAAEIAATLFGGVLIKVCNARWAFFISNVIALAGGLCILFFGHKYENAMPAFVIIAKFGVSSTYMLVYAVTIDLFPTLFAATAFGLCNFIANLTTIVTPYLATMADPIPMLVFCSLASAGIFMSFILVLPKKISEMETA